jgi:GTPase SAR1 family protein
VDPALYYNKAAAIFDPNDFHFATLPVNNDVEETEKGDVADKVDVADKGDIADKDDVGMPLVGIQSSNEDIHGEGWPQGPSLHFPQDSNGDHPAAVIPQESPLQDENNSDFSSTPLPQFASAAQVKKSAEKEKVDILQIYRKCIGKTERYHSFVESQRNKFDFALALSMSRAGIDMENTLQLLLHDYNFVESEVRSCVKSAYSYAGPEKAASKRGFGNAPEQPVIKPGWEAMLPPDAKQPPSNDHASEEPKSDNQADHTGEPVPASVETPQTPAQLLNQGTREPFNIKISEDILRYLFLTRRNLVTGIIEIKEKNSTKAYRRLEDPEENSILRMLWHNKQKIPQSMLHAILNSDFSPAYHPFRSYYKTLPLWDKTTDYIGQLAATIRTTDDEYWNFCFPKWFVAFAMGLIVDEIINHTVIVLVGNQGIGKTTFFKRLMPKSLSSYVSASVPHADSKDMLMQIGTCGLIILDDFDGIPKKELLTYKGQFTAPDVNVRRPYGHNSEFMVRHASFVAAANHGKILTDLTGSRRFLCFDVKTIDYLHKVDIDGCMAQAYALYMSGFQYWFDKEQIVKLTDHNEDFSSKSVVQELIAVWISKVPRSEWDNRANIVNGQSIRRMNATQIATFLMEKTHFILTDYIVIQIGKIMNKLEFEFVKKGNQHYYLLRIVDAVDVEKESYPPIEADTARKESEDNQQIINLEEDLSDSFPKDDLPF